MNRARSSASPHGPTRGFPFAVTLALLGALLAGTALSIGQTYGPQALSPLFNSAAPVVALAAAVSLASRFRWASMLLGSVAGPLAVVGYYATSAARGYGVGAQYPLLWGVAGLISGAAMGWCVWILRRAAENPRWAVALAAGFPAGIAWGEAAHGVRRIAGSTPVAYWWVEAAIGSVVLVWLAITRVTRGLGPSAAALHAALAVAAAAAVAAALFAVAGAL